MNQIEDNCAVIFDLDGTLLTPAAATAGISVLVAALVASRAVADPPLRFHLPSLASNLWGSFDASDTAMWGQYGVAAL